MTKKLRLACLFCGRGTNFEDGGKTYCIDCYCKIRNIIHKHEVINPHMSPSFPYRPTTPYPHGGMCACSQCTLGNNLGMALC